MNDGRLANIACRDLFPRVRFPRPLHCFNFLLMLFQVNCLNRPDGLVYQRLDIVDPVVIPLRVSSLRIFTS